MRFTDREKHRLRLAAISLRNRGVRFDCPRNEFYDACHSAMSQLSPEEQAAVWSMVDWTEEYDLASAAEAATEALVASANKQAELK